MTSKIRIGIPEKGRTGRDTLDKLVKIGWFDESLALRINEVLV